MTRMMLRRIGSGPLKLGILTSLETRHRFFAHTLAAQFDACCVVYAKPTYAPIEVDDSDLSDSERSIIARHFAERVRQEQAFFGGNSPWIEPRAGRKVVRVEPGKLNSPEILHTLQEQNVQVIAVFGTDLIKPPLLAPDSWTLLNLHLGLSPYYRGTATNFYPLLNEEPEFVGATIHVIDPGIDSGPIVCHARPVIEASDGPHSIGCHAIHAGVEAMCKALAGFERHGCLVATKQWPVSDARVYLRKDYHPRHVVELYRKWENGLLTDYLARKPRNFRLVNLEVPETGGAQSSGLKAEILV